MTAAIDALRKNLNDFDGKAISFLGEAETVLCTQEGYIDALIALLAERKGHLASGASWLLKSALEGASDLTPDQIAGLIKRLPDVDDWSAQLHICQMIRLLPGLGDVSGKLARDLADWLTAWLDHKRPFIRAWSLDALGALAKQHGDHAAVFNDALAAALSDEAASVRARARGLSPV